MFDNECRYCTINDTLLDIMTPICEVDGFRLYLFKNQAYRGRTILAYDGHAVRIADLERMADYFLAVQKVSKAIHRAFAPDQINIGTFGDSLLHVHVHIVPKYKGCLNFGEVFQMNPLPEVHLSDQESVEMIGLIKDALSAL